MEYIPRGSLRLWVGYLSLAQLAGVLEGLLAGLAAVEPRGIVHRDLKPENVMVTADGRVKIADFGIAKATEAVDTGGLASSSGAVTVGTPAYMAPEQALCEEVGPWTDLYSIGIMAYENLVGHVPFHETSTPMGMLLRRIRDPIPEPVEANDSIDPALSDWVAGLLVRDPVERASSATAVWEDLEEIVIGLLGPRWRRDARLADEVDAELAAKPLSPAQFMSQHITMQTPTPQVAIAPSSHDTRRAPTTVLRAPKPAQRRVLPLRLIAGIGVLLAATVGFSIARALTSTSASGFPGAHVSSAGLSVSLPAGWRVATVAAATPHFELARAFTFLPGHGVGSFTLGMSTAASAAFLPAGLLSNGATPKRESITLGGRGFFRYPTAVLGRAGDSATIYTQPTTAGVLVGVCWPSLSVSTGCEQILGTATLAGAHALSLAQSAHYAAALSGVIRTFNAARRQLAGDLARAGSSAAQAEASRGLGEIARRAASGLGSLVPASSERPINSALIAALSGIGHGYALMSAAARRERQSDYNAGVRDVAAASLALRKALAGLAVSG